MEDKKKSEILKYTIKSYYLNILGKQWSQVRDMPVNLTSICY